MSDKLNAKRNVTLLKIKIAESTQEGTSMRSCVTATQEGRCSSSDIDAQCTGSTNRLWNVRLDTVEDAFKIAVAIGSL